MDSVPIVPFLCFLGWFSRDLRTVGVKRERGRNGSEVSCATRDAHTSPAGEWILAAGRGQQRSRIGVNFAGEGAARRMPCRQHRRVLRARERG